jgi:hypothetical protein
MAETPDRVVKASKKPRIAVFMGISPLLEGRPGFSC